MTQVTRDLAGRAMRTLRANRPTPEFVTSFGRVREADKDKYSFILRDRPNNETEMHFTYSDEHEERVRDAWTNDYVVFVIGNPTNLGYRLLDIIDADESVADT